MPRFLALAAAAALAAAPLAAQDLLVYDDDLQNGFQDWSWAAHNLDYTLQHHGGTASIQMVPANWEALYFHGPVLAGSDYLELRFWVKGQASGGQQLRIVFWLDQAEQANVELEPWVTGGISGTQWRQAVVPLAAIGLGSASFNELLFQADGVAPQPEVLFDDIVFTADPTPPGVVAVAVDPDAGRRPISAFVYGVNFASAAQIADVGYTVNRWGGNRTTRYNWQLDVDNSAFDWFYQNYTKTTPEPPLPEGSEMDRFVTETRSAGAEAVLTLPALGRVAGPDRQRRWSFSQLLYGPQLEDECSYFPPPPPGWCQEDAGNGLCDPAINTTGFCSPGGRIVGNDPDETSVAVAPSFSADQLSFVVSRVGSSVSGGVRFVALDNEPMLWNSTHADVHPEPATYDEVWQRGAAVASAAKQRDAGVKVLGPDTWGWCDLWTSAADALDGDCTNGPDRQAHGGVPFVEWYLGEVCDHLASTGERLVDYVDVHYYPQSGEAFGGESYAALRLQSIRELWDPQYVSQSWIGAAPRLVPRLREWIAAACPGTGIAITEYSWGADDAPSGALAQAEILAIFGREGVDLATRWVVPETGTKTEEAFRLYLDYDGAGARVVGESVTATSSEHDAVGAYAVRGPGDELFVLLFNKDTVAREVAATIAAAVSGPAQLWRFTAATPLGAAGSIAVAGNAFAATLPARSATLARLRVVSNLVFRDGVESGSTRAWSAASP
ncbi:MAG: endoglucanase [Thermoanaerobaculia bacterium]|nr:MAG: endoglucanase [Thermoanaerobaculia bacterium]